MTITKAESYSNNIIPNDEFSDYHGSRLPELEYYKFYDELKPAKPTVVVYPIFTQNAYEWDGLRDYLNGYCDSCYKMTFTTNYKKTLSASGNGFRILEFLGYEIIDDIDLDKNPKILEKYDKVILLHNEFVTKNEFDAITNHPKVIYLYPGALSTQIKVDYSDNTLMLIRGPGFPESNISNGFGWKYDNLQYFDDWKCRDWSYYEIENGHMLNCYPETELPLYGKKILETMKNL